MKYIYKYLIFCMLFLCSMSAFSQVLISENFDKNTSFPQGWMSPTLPAFIITSSNACAGNSARGPLNANSIAPSLEYTSQVATGNDIVITFNYKIQESGSNDPTNEDFGEFHLQYSIDDGKTWVTYNTIEQSNHTPSSSCTSITHTIAGVDVPAGSDFGWRITGVYNQGNNYIFIDNFEAIEDVACKQPFNLQMEEVSVDSIKISWEEFNSAPATEWEVAYCPEGIDPSNPVCFLNNIKTATSNPYTITGLTNGTKYDIYVRAVCDSNPDVVSAWTGPITVQTTAYGTDCSKPFDIASLPFNHISDTEIYGNTFNGTPGSGCSTAGDFLQGFEVVYKYISPFDDILQIELSGDLTGAVGVFVYEACSAIGSECFAGAITANGVDFGIKDLFVEADKEYYIVVSTFGADSTTKYTLDITSFDCAIWGAPAGKGSYEFYGQTLADFSQTRIGVNSTIEGGELIWYSDAALTSDITDLSAVTLSDNDIFWVTQKIMYMGCVSPALQVTFIEFDCSTLGVTDSWAVSQICDQGSTVLQATSDTNNLLWYDQASGGLPIAIGAAYKTPELTKTTSFWVSDFFRGEGTLKHQGNPGPNSINEFNTDLAGLEFELYEPIAIKDVQVYVTGTGGDLTIRLEDAKGSTQERIINVPGGTSTSPKIVTLNLNFEIVDPNEGPFKLVKVSGPNLLGTPVADASFPYPIGSSGKITSGYSKGTSSTYYYFYNWSIFSSVPLCESNRVEVKAVVNETIAIDVVSEDAEVCVGGETKLTVSSTDLDYIYSWEWEDENGILHTAQGAEVTVNLNQRTNFIAYAQNPNTGCSINGEVFVEVIGVGDIPIYPTEVSVCVGEIVELYAGKIQHTFENNITDWTLINYSVTSTASGVDPSVAGWKQVASPYSGIEDITSSNDKSTFMISNAHDLKPGSGVFTEMISPSINLVGVSSASLEFYHYYRHHASKITTPSIMVSIDGGKKWKTIETYYSDRGLPSKFEKVSLNLKDYLGNANVQIKFSYTGEWGWWWAIDNVSILQTYLNGQVIWEGDNIDVLYLDRNAKHPYVGETTSNVIYFKAEEKGTYNFEVELEIEGCVSSVVNTVTIEVNSAEAPVGPAEQDFNAGAKVIDIEVLGDSLKYFLEIDGEFVRQTINAELIDGQTYYISQQIGECESEFLEVYVNVLCPEPTNLTVTVELDEKGYTASAIIFWEHPENIEVIDGYHIIVKNETGQIIEDRILSSQVNYLIVETLFLEKEFSVGLYSICDDANSVYSNVLEAVFTTKSLSMPDFQEMELKYSPNPVTDILSIQSDFSLERLELITITGKRILVRDNINSTSIDLDLSELATGTYLMKATVEGQTKVLRIIKK